MHLASMMRDMCTFASVLGSYLPGSYPQFMAPGLALHICVRTFASIPDLMPPISFISTFFRARRASVRTRPRVWRTPTRRCTTSRTSGSAATAPFPTRPHATLLLLRFVSSSAAQVVDMLILSYPALQLAIAIKGSESLIQYLDSDASAKSKA